MHIKHQYLLASIVWFLAIWFFSSLPSSTFPVVGSAESQSVHIIEYFVFALLVARTWVLYELSFHYPLLVFVLMGILVLAGADELHQMVIPGRQSSWIDFSFDAVGIIFGFLIFFLMESVKKSFTFR